jgi:hypothetical protein
MQNAQPRLNSKGKPFKTAAAAEQSRRAKAGRQKRGASQGTPAHLRGQGPLVVNLEALQPKPKPKPKRKSTGKAGSVWAIPTAFETNPRRH